MSPPVVTEADIKQRYPELLSEYARGMSIRQLAGQYGVGYGTVHRYLTMLGAQFRRRGGPHGDRGGRRGARPGGYA